MPKPKGPEQEGSEHFWVTCVQVMVQKLGCPVELEQEDYDTIAFLYEEVGGSWESLAAGDAEKWGLLRKACKVYLKRKLKESDEE
jgi:hypothetical protein